MSSQAVIGGRPGIVDAQAAVRSFLKEALPEVHRVDVVRLVAVAAGDAAWEAEAVVWQPNATLETLGLTTQRPVLDRNAFVVRLDGQLNVIGYETADAERMS
jgi:hypothetical protein